MDLKSRSKRRAMLLELAFDKFRPELIKHTAARLGLNANNISGITINPSILYAVTTSYFLDLERAKDFHETSLANEYRQAAFTVKWLMKFRPINDTNADGRFLLANEKFALAVAFSQFGVSIPAVGDTLYAHLMYTIRFRVIDEGALIAIFMALKPIK
jgi:hypothetical protein